jgi:hypothetical protein
MLSTRMLHKITKEESKESLQSLRNLNEKTSILSLRSQSLRANKTTTSTNTNACISN